MSEKNHLSKQNIETIDIEKKSDIFEELNLPPQFATFCRENSENIKKIAVCIFIVVTAWGGYDYYSKTQVEKSTTALALAVRAEDQARTEKLTTLLEKHSGSDAALWGVMELAHLDQKNGNYQEAIDRYKEALDNVDEDGSLVPLLHFSLAQAYELNNDQENAIREYQKMTGSNGFSDMGNLALGRLYEKNGEPDKARDAYEKVENDQSGLAKERLAVLIPSVKAGK